MCPCSRKHVQSAGDNGESNSASERIAGITIRLPDRASRGGPWGFG